MKKGYSYSESFRRSKKAGTTASRAGDVLARLGGHQFTYIVPFFFWCHVLKVEVSTGHRASQVLAQGGLVGVPKNSYRALFPSPCTWRMIDGTESQYPGRFYPSLRALSR